MDAVALGRAGADVDDAAEAPAKVGAVGPRLKRQIRDKLGVDGGAEAGKVKDARDQHAVGVHPGITWGRAPHHQQPTAKRRARHARQVLDSLDRVALGAGDAL